MPKCPGKAIAPFFRRTLVLRRISLHEFPCTTELEITNNLAEFLNGVLGFRLSVKIAEKSLRNFGNDLPARPDLLGFLLRSIHWCAPCRITLEENNRPFPSSLPFETFSCFSSLRLCN